MIRPLAFVSNLGFLIQTNLTNSKNFKKKHFYGRIACAAMIPLTFTALALNTLCGLGNGVLAIATRGNNTRFFTSSTNHLNFSNFLISQPFFCLLKTINPNANLITDPKHNVLMEPDGNLTCVVKRKLNVVAENQRNSKNLFKHHVTSRLTFVLMGIASLVMRAVDAIIGIIAGIGAIITGGNFKLLNTIAYKSLQTPGIIADLWYCTMHVINPDASKPIPQP